MKSSIWPIGFLGLLLIMASCTSPSVTAHGQDGIVFTDVQTDYRITDQNNYGCNKIDATVLNHILENGIRISEREVHDHFSTTGCTIKGNLKASGKPLDFIYDYGGIMYFADGSILGCAENCCRDNYPNCSWDAEDLKGK